MEPIACCRGMPCQKCVDKWSLWDTLALGEVSVPSVVIDMLQSGVPREDVVKPLSVPDPRDKERALLRVRTHWNGMALVQAYDQCPVDGLFVNIEWEWAGGADGQPDVGKGTTGSILLLPSKAALSNADCKNSDPLKGVLVFISPAPFDKPCTRELVIVFWVDERRSQAFSVNAMQADRLSGLFCDVTLCVDGQDFPAHKVVLAACSDVFRAMFTADFKEKSAARVDIGGTTAKAFGKFLDFLYTDEQPTWDECELKLLELADQYQVPRLKGLAEWELWLLSAKSALSVLLRAATKPILAPAVQYRLCRLVARDAASLEETAEWEALQRESPLVAGAISGMEAAGCVFAPIVHCCDGLPVREGAGEPA